MLGLAPIAQWYLDAVTTPSTGARPTCVASLIVGGCDGATDNIANIGEPTLARLIGVTNCDTDEAITDLELTCHVTEFYSGEDVGGEFEASVELGEGDVLTNNYQTTIPDSISDEFEEGNWYYLWWVGDGFLKRVGFVAKYGGS